MNGATHLNTNCTQCSTTLVETDVLQVTRATKKIVSKFSAKKIEITSNHITAIPNQPFQNRLNMPKSQGNHSPDNAKLPDGSQHLAC